MVEKGPPLGRIDMSQTSLNITAMGIGGVGGC